MKRVIGGAMIAIPFVGLFIVGGELIGYSAMSLVFAGVAFFVVWLFIGIELLSQ